MTYCRCGQAVPRLRWSKGYRTCGDCKAKRKRQERQPDPTPAEIAERKALVRQQREAGR